MRRRTKTPQVGLAYFLLASSLPAQKEVFVPANDVSFTLSAERPTYRSGEQITLNFIPGYAGSCSESSNPKTVSKRMNKEAVLLKPGEHLDGILRLDTKLFSGLKPGVYRIEAVLWSWRDEKFTDAERSELARMGHPFLRGEVPNSTSVTLTPDAK